MSKKIRQKIGQLTLGVLVVQAVYQPGLMAQEVVHNQVLANNQIQINQSITTDPAINVVEVEVTTGSAISHLEMLGDGEYTVDLKVWKETQDEDSMCSQFIGKEDAKLSVVDGKMTLTTYFLKNPMLGNTVSEDAINEVEYKEADSTWVEVEKVLKTKVINGKEEEIWEVKIPVDNQGATFFARAGIRPMFGMKPVFRVVLQEETLEKVLNPLELKEVKVTNETVAGKEDGRIEITAKEGSGNYQYSIDGGITYQVEHVFEGLAPGSYTVVVSDSQTKEEVAEQVTIHTGERVQLEDGKYTVDLKVWKETQDEDSMCSQFIGKEDAELSVVDGKMILTTYFLKNPMLGNTVSEDAINEVEYKEADSTWVEVEKVLKTKIINGKEEEIWEVKFPVDNQGATFFARAGIRPMFGMKPAFRVVLQEETLEKVLNPLELKEVKVTNETIAGKEDGRIEIIAKEGSGNYEYSVDGGITYQVEGVFEGLVPGSYTIVVRDRQTKEEVTEEAILEGGKIATPVQIVEIKSTNPSFKEARDGNITIGATGGDNKLEYSIDGGKNWSESNTFNKLGEAVYDVVARDTTNESNQSQVTKVTLKVKDSESNTIKDGHYGVDITVLKEDSNEPSMAAQFFQRKNLPVEVIDGKLYLKLRVNKDGMGLTDVIQGLEQKVGGSYESLPLEFEDDETKRYVTTEIEMNNFQEEVYMRCAITPMLPVKPVLRIRMVEGSLVENGGNIEEDVNLGDQTAITSIKVANGKIDMTFNREDVTIIKEDFKAMIKIEGKESETLELKDFKKDGLKVSFTYDKIEASEEVKEVKLDMIFRDNPFATQVFTVNPMDRLNFKFKENATEIAYIKGYGDGKFKPNQVITRHEALTMVSRLMDVEEEHQEVVDIKVLHATKDEESMAAQFFDKEGVKVTQNEQGYTIELQIANEGLGFTDIINSMELEQEGKYTVLEVNKSADMKYSTVCIQVADLKEVINLRAGIAPMGEVKPILRVEVDEKSLRKVTLDEETVKQEIFEVLEVATEESSTQREDLTRGEFLEILVKVAQLEVPTVFEHKYTDIDAEDENLAYIIAATTAGYVEGYKDGKFVPNGTVTRAEAVTMINRMIKNKDEVSTEKSPFTDVDRAHWAFEDIIRATK